MYGTYGSLEINISMLRAAGYSLLEIRCSRTLWWTYTDEPRPPEKTRYFYRNCLVSLARRLSRDSLDPYQNILWVVLSEICELVIKKFQDLLDL